MSRIYLVGVGTYSQRTILCAFLDGDEAEKYRTHHEQHPLRTLGPTGPVWVEETELYDTAANAIEEALP